jgi:hypothetical protein
MSNNPLGHFTLSRITTALLFLVLLHASPASADGPASVSGRLDLHGVQTLESGSIDEDTSLIGRLRIDQELLSLKFHSWLEGGWDGTVRRPANDHSLIKNYDQVYQSNTPYLEFKELYLARSWNELDLKAGIQRFAWGRLDEYPPNDLFNPWDYTQFLRKPLEDRKIGVPSVSATMSRNDWTMEMVWVPVLVPYRLPLPDERWSGSGLASNLTTALPNATIVVREPDLPDRTIRNSNAGIRIKNAGAVDWALNLYHGYDPRPVFRTTSIVITPTLVIDPGYVPDFHRISVVGLDAAVVKGDLSLRAEMSCSFHRMLNIRRELWGYPTTLAPGVFPLNAIGQEHNVIDYGIGADYRVFEDGLLTMQAQQTVILGNRALLYEKRWETILWANLKVGWFNQKVETNINIAYNPEHRDHMTKANAWYILSDAWKVGTTVIAFNGPDQSLFGRYARNDQVEMDLVYSW